MFLILLGTYFSSSEYNYLFIYLIGKNSIKSDQNVLTWNHRPKAGHCCMLPLAKYDNILCVYLFGQVSKSTGQSYCIIFLLHIMHIILTNRCAFFRWRHASIWAAYPKIASSVLQKAAKLEKQQSQRINVTERSRKLLRDVRLRGGLNIRCCSALSYFFVQ